MRRLFKPFALAIGLFATATITGSCSPERPTAPLRKFDLAPASVGSDNLVLSQAYPGGGNATSTFRAKFVEIFNRGNTTVVLNGYSIQYASATGTGSFANNGVALLSGSIPAGKYFLVQIGTAATGTPLPVAVDQVTTATLNTSATTGKLVLVNSTAGLGCNGFSTPCSAAQSALIVDLLGYGGANFFEGSGAAPAPSNTLAAFRKVAGCQDTDNNSADFTSATPSPRNSASPANPAMPCTTPPPAVDRVTISPTSATTFVGDQPTFTAQAFDNLNNPIPGSFTFSTSDALIASIDAATGKATGVAPGDVTITATASGKSATASLHVDPAPPVVPAFVVVSQVYGGGGNGGATLKNDFIELFNAGTDPVSLAGWSVQYGSGGATTVNGVTPLIGTIQPGQYYLVQGAAGAGGTADLPTPDVIGSLALGATGGRIILARSTLPQNVACPSGGVIQDFVPYGTTSGCSPAAPAPANATAILRKNGGCKDTNDPAADFSVVAPAPRNSGSPTRSCVVGPLDHVTIDGTLTALVGATRQLTAVAEDLNNNSIEPVTFTWTSSDPTIASVDANGLVTGVLASVSTVTITATTTVNGITKSASVQFKVNNLEINWIDVTARSTSFPVGFQTEVFFTARTEQDGTVIPATFAVQALDPQVLEIFEYHNEAIVTAVGPQPDPNVRPSFRVTATPVGGGNAYSFDAHPITVETPIAPPPGTYSDNIEFGKPTAAPATGTPNDRLIVHPEFTLSYNESRGTPNWVSYELDSRHILTGADRCNCFTAEPALSGDKVLYTADYTNGGFDRGHMAPSADRISSNVANATTFYLSNIVPQTGDLNQGVWANFESHLRTLVRDGDRAIYVITGPLYDPTKPQTSIKNEGRILIPHATWKVAFIGPKNGGSPFTKSTVTSWDDLTGTSILAVSMPNITGVRNDPWANYLTTVDAIEAATGYDFLSLLPVAFQTAIEAGDRGPSASFSLSGTRIEGSVLSLTGAGSDPDLGRTDMSRTEALSFSWSFGDGTTAFGATPTKTFANNGTYTVTLTVTDAFGWEATATQTIAIDNVPPAVAPIGGATILPNETYSATGSFSDPGADSWTATVDYGDGSVSQSLVLSGKSFSLSHAYATPGTFTVTVSVNDGLEIVSRTATVTVKSHAQAIEDVDAMLRGLALSNGNLNSLLAKLEAALRKVEQSQPDVAANQLGALLNEIDALQRSGRLSSSNAAAVSAAVQRVIDSLT
jgi:DNA/RNA endonuclease G (NUC1)